MTEYLCYVFTRKDSHLFFPLKKAPVFMKILSCFFSLDIGSYGKDLNLQKKIWEEAKKCLNLENICGFQ